jgi:transcriptional/translational regulatory protein YebC/TACO1
MFQHVGEITYKAAAGSADAVLEAAIEAGADDAVSDETGHLITCSFETLGTVAGALEEKLGEPQSVKSIWKPNLTTPVDEEAAQSIFKMIAALEDDDDVQSVFANFEISDEIMKRLTAA